MWATGTWLGLFFFRQYSVQYSCSWVPINPSIFWLKYDKSKMHWLHLGHRTSQLGNTAHCRVCVVLCLLVMARLTELKLTDAAGIRERIRLYITSLGKRSKFKVQFLLNAYYFHAIMKLKKLFIQTSISWCHLYMKMWDYVNLRRPKKATLVLSKLTLHC
jgi:hypothetical protein